MITLYDYSMAPSPRRARILLAEKGVTYETVVVDLRASEQMGKAYRVINPQCTVPSLQLEGGQVLTDNAAIAAYLEARYPEPPLLGSTPLEKAEIAGWNWRLEADGLTAVTEALRNAAPAMRDRALTGPTNYAQIPELGERGLARVKRFFDMLDAHLSNREWIATDRFTLADITAVVAIDFARVVKVKVGDGHPHLRRWREAMDKRPSVST